MSQEQLSSSLGEIRMKKQSSSIHSLSNILSKRIMILDGAIGTLVQDCNLGENDYRGERFGNHPVDLKGNHDILSLTQPDKISQIHKTYLAAGADIIQTNTFNSNAISQSDYHLQDYVYEMNFSAAKIAGKGAGIKADPILEPALIIACGQADAFFSGDRVSQGYPAEMFCQ